MKPAMTMPDRLAARQAMLQQLRQWSACPAGMEWVRSTPATSFGELWSLFTRADWAAWLLHHVTDDLKLKTTITLDFAETALPIFEREFPSDPRVRDCIATGRRWCDGTATDDEWQRAAADAADAEGSAWDARARRAADAAWSARSARAADAAVSAVSAGSASHAELCALIRRRVPDIEALAKAEGGSR